MDVARVLLEAQQRAASDVHLSANSSPVFRIHGDLITEGPVLTPMDTESMARQLLSQAQWEQFERVGDIDCAVDSGWVSRCRVSVYRQRGCISIAARLIRKVVPVLGDLQLPDLLSHLPLMTQGLVLVTGPTGSGKSTTLAAVIDHVNRTQRKHVITLEDPIEYWHQNILSVVEQREIGTDVRGFDMGLRSALRQDPDVIMVGEIRDRDTMYTALTAAETGHLVLASLHTNDAVQTIDRIIDVFPEAQHAQVRNQLASVLQGVIAQMLVKRSDGGGRVPVCEVLVNTPAVANLIRSQKTHQVRSVMQSGRSVGMQTMEMALREHVSQGRISPLSIPVNHEI